MGDDDPDIATLMRLAEDPLRLSRFMAGEPAGVSGQRMVGGVVAANCAAGAERRAVSNWKGESAVHLREYGCCEQSDRSSLHPFRFVPDMGEAETAVDGGFKRHSDHATAAGPVGLWTPMQRVMAIITVTGAILLLLIAV
jgi:hypothetical protein